MDGLGAPVNCPLCGKRMAHLLSQAAWHFYWCDTCGPMTVPPNGLVRRTDPTDYDAMDPDEGTHGT